VPGVDDEKVHTALVEPPPVSATVAGQVGVRPVAGVTVVLVLREPAKLNRLLKVTVVEPVFVVGKLTAVRGPLILKSPTLTTMLERWNSVPSVTLNVTT
jgi:hypothetical protein